LNSLLLIIAAGEKQ